MTTHPNGRDPALSGGVESPTGLEPAMSTGKPHPRVGQIWRHVNAWPGYDW